MKERANVKESDPAETVRAKIADLMESIALEGWEERSEQVARALLGVEREDEPHLEGEEFQGAAIELVVGSTLAQGGRRLIVFEDLHWCDHASLELVRATTELVAENPIVVLASFRPDREAISWEFKEWVETRLAAHATVLELDSLSAEQSDELIGAFLPIPEMTGSERQRILRNTEGNPLFMQEVARALIDGGVVEQRGGGVAADGRHDGDRDPRHDPEPDHGRPRSPAGVDASDGADGRRDRADLRGGAPRRGRRPGRGPGRSPRARAPRPDPGHRRRLAAPSSHSATRSRRRPRTAPSSPSTAAPPTGESRRCWRRRRGSASTKWRR